MRCPYCQDYETRVLDSRTTADNDSIRRRRECSKCTKRFTTYERVELMDISIVKKDGRRENFERDKILRGVLKACEKRPIKREKIDQVVSNIEQRVRQSDKTEIKSRKLGQMVMEELMRLDQVAYVRFASVYKKFKDTEQFVDMIKTLKKEVKQ